MSSKAADARLLRHVCRQRDNAAATISQVSLVLRHNTSYRDTIQTALGLIEQWAVEAHRMQAEYEKGNEHAG